MKTYPYFILLILFNLIWINLAHSKVDITSNFGVKLGYGFANADISNHPSSPSGSLGRSSLTGGLFVHFSHVDFVRLQLELLYLQKGFKHSGFEAEMDCLSVPIMVRFQIPFGIYFNGGIGITYLISGKVESSYNTSTNLDDYFERLHYDVIGGIGWQVGILERGSIFVEARLTYTINNISINYPDSFHPYTAHVYVGFQY